MTSLISLPPQVQPRPDPSPEARQRPAARGRTARLLRHPAPWLLCICLAQFVLTRVSDRVATAFDDEGLYVYMGHRMIDHFLDGTVITEFPGSYFSGSPALYPVLAALADSVGGLQAARDLSLVMVMVTTVAVFGFGAAMFGRLAGVLGAAFFATCGSVTYVAAWATFDAMMMMLVMLAAWLAAWSARRNALAWAPAVACVLALAMFTKYAAVGYLPFVVLVAMTEGWPTRRWLGVRRAVFMAIATAVVVYSFLMLFARELIGGIVQTTSDREILNPASSGEMLGYIGSWVGPWLAVIGLGAVVLVVRTPRRAPTALVLLGAAVVGPAQQVQIGELTSLGKHLAFGIAFAAPLAGYLLAWVAGRRRWWGSALAAVPVAAVVAALTVRGLTLASEFRTAYPDDSRLVATLRAVVAQNEGRPVLGEQPSAQRYALRDVIAPRQWADTYSFGYRGLTGADAYQRAIQDHYFGVIYLNFSTANATPIVESLGDAQGPGHYYDLVAKVPRYLRGERAGVWLVWAPQTADAFDEELP